MLTTREEVNRLLDRLEQERNERFKLIAREQLIRLADQLEQLRDNDRAPVKQ